MKHSEQILRVIQGPVTYTYYIFTILILILMQIEKDNRKEFRSEHIKTSS